MIRRCAHDLRQRAAPEPAVKGKIEPHSQVSRSGRQNIRGERGFGLLLTLLALALTVLIMGLVIDTGQIFVVEQELQSFADDAATTAAYDLDGSRAGLDRARRAVEEQRNSLVENNSFSFAIPASKDIRIAFAQKPGGAFQEQPPSALGRRLVKVSATATARLWLLPVLPNIAAEHPVSAYAVAGQVPLKAAREGLAPFSPVARDPFDSNFGFEPGRSYPLSWAPSGKGATPGGERRRPAGRWKSPRGYIDVGQQRDEAGAEDAVLNASFYLKRPLAPGSEIHYLSREVNLASALRTRFHQDTDTSSTTYEAYAERGNGRRILVAPVNDGNDPALVVGFATFLEQAAACSGENRGCRATYVGNSPVIHGKGNGAGPPGLYEVALLE